MKRTIIISCIAAATLTFTACDNYLDLVPKGESVLNETSDYLGLLEDMYGYPLGNEWYLCGEHAPADVDKIKDYTNPLMSASFFWNEDFDRTSYMTATGSGDLYSMCYNKIAKYNIIIQNISDAKGSDSDKIEGMAQAKILRAYNYFFLINTYAKPYDPATATQERGVILRDEFSLEEEGVQKTVADAYNLIQQDIEDALPGLPHKSLNTFRPDKSFGYALKAKVHLFKREFDQALQASLDCLKEAEGEGNHQLWDMNVVYQYGLTEFKNSKPGLNFMPDSWFEYGGTMYFSFRMVASMTYFKREYDNTENLLYQHGLNFMSPQAAVIRKPVLDLFSPKEDLRYTFCIATTTDGPATREPGSKMINNMFFHWNCGGVKLSEVYLMAAECYARKGDKDNALKYVNDLRKNRLLKTYYKDLTATDATEAMRIVREERKRELLFTSNGFFDMRRFCTEFNETLTREFEQKTYTLKPTSHLLTFPFPVVAMQNSNLIQNSK